MARMPPVEVPVIKSKCSTILRPVTFSNVASTVAEKAPMMPPPSRLRMRNGRVMMAQLLVCLIQISSSLLHYTSANEQNWAQVGVLAEAVQQVNGASVELAYV